jgi:hypothetical protein
MPEPMVLAGRGRMLVPPGDVAPATVTLDEVGFRLALGGEHRAAAYRDLETIAIQSGAALLALGTGSGAERVLLDQFGASQGQLVRELRDRRLRQRAADALITLDGEAPIDLLEYEADGLHGVAQLAYDAWGALLVPLDERLAPIRIRRSSIESVLGRDGDGSVEVGLATRRGGTITGLRLVGLGAAARIHADRFEALRAGAHADAARIVGGLIPDASYGARQEAAGRLLDGRPAGPGDLPASWAAVEAGVLVDPMFAATYRALLDRAGPLADGRSIAIAPTEPGGDESRSWFLVPLPGNLVALELVSEGAHATYAYRVVPRATFGGGAPDPDAIRGAIDDVSEALVDGRFLREPMSLTDVALAEPRNLRYRLALAAIPSLAVARERFVARIVHRDEASWAGALDALIAWHGTAHDDAAAWPGRAAADEEIETIAAADDTPPALVDLQGAT